MVSYQGAKAAIAAFEECCRLGQLWDETGLITPPPELADWGIYVDGGKADRIPADNRDHLIQLYGPEGYGHLWTNARVTPSLKVVHPSG